MTSPAGSKLSRSPAGGEPAVEGPLPPQDASGSPAGSNAPAAALTPFLAAAGDTKLPSGTAREMAVPEGDEQDAAREWADSEAVRIGGIWLARFPGGRDW